LFSVGIPVSSTNKTNHHDITEIMLKVVLNTINQTSQYFLEEGFLLAKSLQNKGFQVQIFKEILHFADMRNCKRQSLQSSTLSTILLYLLKWITYQDCTYDIPYTTNVAQYQKL
jgi:hypothetical protein